ncbi:hypothetical protein [Nitrososphaeria virus YSH_922147]|uniref:Uncharacterized protein n=1 Tax=Nitrososphaeria virus YSH_922147 TaxID=3071323 RepID=A0A976UAR0_9CAUD|nr:hypothetical protein QKV94_gp22 [Yangshan Harbor Nitrososphaeria virus]UVF62431.1 hypothetical protein [Nitrososphaeria virus YSH_922147]
MVEQRGSGRKDTGRTDKYSDETPKKDFADYRKDYPNDNKEPRKSKEKDPVKSVGKKSIEVRKQELVAHLQTFQETFNSVQFNMWKEKAEHLLNQINIS